MTWQFKCIDFGIQAGAPGKGSQHGRRQGGTYLQVDFDAVELYARHEFPVMSAKCLRWNQATSRGGNGLNELPASRRKLVVIAYRRQAGPGRWTVISPGILPSLRQIRFCCRYAVPACRAVAADAGAAPRSGCAGRNCFRGERDARTIKGLAVVGNDLGHSSGSTVDCRFCEHGAAPFPASGGSGMGHPWRAGRGQASPVHRAMSISTLRGKRGEIEGGELAPMFSGFLRADTRMSIRRVAAEKWKANAKAPVTVPHENNKAALGGLVVLRITA